MTSTPSLTSASTRISAPFIGDVGGDGASPKPVCRSGRPLVSDARTRSDLLCHLAITPEFKMPFYNYLMQYKHALAIRQMYTRRRQTKTPSNRHRRRAEFVNLPIWLRALPPPGHGYKNAADPVGATVDHGCNGNIAQIGNHWGESFQTTPRPRLSDCTNTPTRSRPSRWARRRIERLFTDRYSIGFATKSQGVSDPPRLFSPRRGSLLTGAFPGIISINACVRVSNVLQGPSVFDYFDAAAFIFW